MTEQKFKHISVGKDGSVWAAGKADGSIFRLYGDAGAIGWVPDKVGQAEVIAAVDWANAWCVNHEHEIWHLTNAESLDKGGTWTKVPTHSGRADAKTISVGNDGSVWYAQTDGVIFHTARSSNGANLSWVQDKVGKADVLAAIDATSLYCVNNEHEIWFGQNSTWSQIPTHGDRADAKFIAVNPDGYAWYASIDGAVFRAVRPGDGVGLPLWGTTWDRKQMGKAAVLAVGPEDLVWCLNTKGEVWRAFDDKWQQLVEQGPDGKVWTYKIKRGDNLLAIVRREFKLKDPQDTQEINRITDLIVAQNRGQLPYLTRDLIKAGDVLTLRY